MYVGDLKKMTEIVGPDSDTIEQIGSNGSASGPVRISTDMPTFVRFFVIFLVQGNAGKVPQIRPLSLPFLSLTNHYSVDIIILPFSAVGPCTAL
jgi:hypothetical protein